MTDDELLLKEQLDSGKAIHITFEKADGSMRDMHATTNTMYIPEHEWSDGAERKLRSSDEVQVVWDIDVAGWRSFRWDRLKSFVDQEDRKTVTL